MIGHNMKYLIILLFSFPIFGAEIDKTVKLLEDKTGCKLIITSGYRTKKKNKEVGGAPNSYHLTNRARGLVPKNKCISIKELGKVACKLTSTIISKDHVHIDNREKPLCWNK